MKLYNYQEEYLSKLLPSCIMAADLGCFVGETAIATPGGYHRIDSLKTGDKVYSYTDDGAVIVSEVDFLKKTSNKPKPMIKFYYDEVPTPITATYDHPFYDGEKYYPLYQLVWRDMETSQRLQLKLLCEQYGQDFNYTETRGITGRDNETWERPSRTPANGYERQDGKGSQSSSRNLDTEPRQSTLHQSQGLQSEEQQSGKSGVVYSETELPTRISERTIKQIAIKSTSEESIISEINRGINSQNMGLLPNGVQTYTSKREQMGEDGSIRQATRPVSRTQKIITGQFNTKETQIKSVEVLPSQTYYGLGIRGEWHTYIVHNFPVHNTGKTLMSLAHWERQGTGRPLLIVAPAAKIRTGDWEQEARRWFPHSNGLYGKVQPDITYISYESLRLMDKETKKPRWWKYTGARNGGKVYDVIADECHALKNPQSKQSKAILEIKMSGGLFIGLSGTPMPNGWIDFAGYSKLFGYVKGITEFKNKYCRIQDYKGFPEIIGYNNTDELDRQFKRVAFKLSREQAAELPSKQMLPVNISMSKKDSKHYYTLKLTRQNSKTGEILDSAPKLLSALRQSTTNGRLDQLLSVVDDTSDNIVIFYNYISERKAILKALAKTDKQILRYDGDQHDTLPASNANISNTVLVAHYKSASTGLNLQWANITIYFSPSYSYQEFEQSMGRTHRNGQIKKCLYYLFNVRGTVDHTIWKCLREKRDFSEKLWRDED